MSIWTLRCHCVSIAEYSKAREGEVKSVVDRWMAELIRDEEKNVVTLCPTCSRAVNGDVGGFVVFEPHPLKRLGAIVGMCRRCFADARKRERYVRQLVRKLEAAGAKVVGGPPHG